MSATEKIDRDGHSDPEGGSSWTQRIPRLVCAGVVVILLPMATGCSPGALIGGAIVGSVLYAHARYEHPGARTKKVVPAVYQPRIAAASVGTMGTYLGSDPPVPKGLPTPDDHVAVASLITEGAAAYREMQWDDAARLLTQAIRTGGGTASEQAQAHILLGAMEYQQGNVEAARTHFAAARRQDPRLEPSPQLFPPPLIDFYEAARGP